MSHCPAQQTPDALQESVMPGPQDAKHHRAPGDGAGNVPPVLPGGLRNMPSLGNALVDEIGVGESLAPAGRD